jgi:transcriptional regulator GlxA family with amidase domain
MQRENIMWTIGSRFHYDEASYQQNPIAAALEFIEDNLDRRLTINRVARQVLVSHATFTRRFKEQTGKTFLEYQTERRLAVAERLLMDTNVPIIEICARVGLKYGRLRMLFQGKHGYSPSVFREIKKRVDINN